MILRGGSGLELFEIVFEIKSPALVTKRLTRRGYHIPLDHIPASMLRGALISSLYMKNLIGNEYLEREAHSPSIITSPAYPMDEEGKSYPAHLFIYECKIPHEKGVQTYNDGRDVLKNVRNGLPLRLRQLCDLGHPALESLHPRLLIPLKGSFKKFELRIQQSVNVGISKHRATSYRGMLFEYEAIAEGTKFWSNICIPEELIDKVKPGFEFSIGRGISRGFGRAVIVDVREIDIEDESEDYVGILKNGGRIVFYALSNLLSIKGSNNSSKYPDEIKLKPIGERFNLNVDGEIILKEVYGRVVTFHSGWDIKRNIERPIIPAASRGSIIIGNVSGNGELSKTLVILGRIGTVEYGLDFNITGVNILIPLEIHPMVG